MRVVLAIVFFSLSAFASSIDYASGGSLAAGTATVTGSVAAGKTWSVTDELTAINSQTGSLGKVDITSGTLVKTSTGFSFTGGSVDITSASGMVLLDATFTSGTITQSGGNTFLNAVLANGGTTEIASKSGVFSSNTIVSTPTVPEVPSLFLVGAGLVGLWWMGREKLMTM